MITRGPHSERVARALAPLDEEGERALLHELRLGDGDRGVSTAEIGTILDRTSSKRLRNAGALALALADRDAAGLALQLSVLLASPGIATTSGTLLFALDRIGGTLAPEAVLNIIANGSYEARAEALAFVDGDRLLTAGSGNAETPVTGPAALSRSEDAGAVEAAREALEPLHSQGAL